MNKIAFVLLILFLFTQQLHAESSLHKNKFVPPEGKVLLIIGQDKDTIDKYVNDIGIIPGGFMGYTSIQNMDGIYSPADYGGGISCFQYLIDKYPNSVMQIGLYMVDALEGVIAGTYDHNIDTLGDWIKQTKRPIYLRIGYEFDGPHNHYEPQAYIKAYRRIVDKLRRNGVDNVAYVWHSYAYHVDRPVSDWYPGDDYVDWFGVSYFSPRANYMEKIVQLAHEHKKPLMISESTPCGIGIHYGNYVLQKWFEPFFDFISAQDVKAVCYINSDWEKLPMWKGQGWGNASVQDNKIIKNRWLNEIKKEKYLQASNGLYKILGYIDKNGK